MLLFISENPKWKNEFIETAISMGTFCFGAARASSNLKCRIRHFKTLLSAVSRLKNKSNETFAEPKEDKT